MNTKYTNDRGTQIVLSLLKSHGIKKVIASPGTTNIALVASMQYDSWFEVYSSVDERSAAYIACGMAASCGEPVVITCTGATASRNYFPGITEAYYRKLPILAITGSHGDELNGHLHPQVIDRSQCPKDSYKYSIVVDKIADKIDERSTIVKVNTALLELTHHGGGPVHINLRAATGAGYTTEFLPVCPVIKRFCNGDELPMIPQGKVALFIGAHMAFPKNTTKEIEEFCENYNGVVFVDHTSNYYGKYAVQIALHACQSLNKAEIYSPDVLIHLGEISGEVYNIYRMRSRETWRVNEDGVIRDLFGNLTSVFEMDEETFFRSYNDKSSTKNKCLDYYKESNSLYNQTLEMMPDLPFGNIWIASCLHKLLPQNAIVHFSIYNSLRSWNFFRLPSSIKAQCNVGGFGIDGPISTIIGSALINPKQLHFLIIGDLAFFYDLNSLGNRHIGNNLRILLINNGCGTEFRNYDHPASQWGEEANEYMAAGGHFGNKSRGLVRNYVLDLGFDYISASNKEEFEIGKNKFLETELSRSIVFEVFTTPEDESLSIKLVRNIISDNRSGLDKSISSIKHVVKSIIR